MLKCFIVKLQSYQSNGQNESCNIELLFHFHPTWQLPAVLCYFLPVIFNILFQLFSKFTRNNNDWHYWNISCKFHQDKLEKKQSKRNILQDLKKEEKHKDLEYETFKEVIENLLLSRISFSKTDPHSFYTSSDDIIIKSFNDITFMPLDMN